MAFIGSGVLCIFFTATGPITSNKSAKKHQNHIILLKSCQESQGNIMDFPHHPSLSKRYSMSTVLRTNFETIHLRVWRLKVGLHKILQSNNQNHNLIRSHEVGFCQLFEDVVYSYCDTCNGHIDCTIPIRNCVTSTWSSGVVDSLKLQAVFRFTSWHRKHLISSRVSCVFKLMQDFVHPQFPLWKVHQMTCFLDHASPSQKVGSSWYWYM